MKLGLELSVAPEMRVGQDCTLCRQEVSAKRQRPFNVIMIEGYSFCPSCHQEVSLEIQRTVEYRLGWHEFARGLSLYK
jgi:hypothetical protein